MFEFFLLVQACIIFNTVVYHNSGGAASATLPDFRGDFGITASRVTVFENLIPIVMYTVVLTIFSRGCKRSYKKCKEEK